MGESTFLILGFDASGRCVKARLLPLWWVITRYLTSVGKSTILAAWWVKTRKQALLYYLIVTPIQDFFICDVTDAIPKDDMGSMEHPIFSLATKPDLSVREYEHNGMNITVVPSALGPRHHPRQGYSDLLHQPADRQNESRRQLPNRTLHIKAHDLLVATNRNTDGRGYEQLDRRARTAERHQHQNQHQDRQEAITRAASA